MVKINIQIERKYYDNGNIRFEKYFANNKLHREDGPAIIHYYQNGNIKSVMYLMNNELHREDKPTSIEYYENGNIKSETYVVHDNYHRIDGPTIIEYYENGNVQREQYYINGTKHRTDGPAYIKYDTNDNIEFKRYYINDAQIYLQHYQSITYNQLIDLINECANIHANINDLLKLKLITNIKFKNEKQHLLELIDSKITMLKLL